MTRPSRLKRVGFAAIVASVTFFCTTNAGRASIYAYARQQISNYTVNGATLGTAVNSSSTSASDDIAGVAKNGMSDSQQSFRGFGAAPAQNTFTPSGLMFDYARGDALISADFVTNNVAESRLAGLVNSAATGSWIRTMPMTVASDQAVTLNFSYLNEITLFHDGSGEGFSSTQASYSWNVSIKDAAGTIVFNSSPSEVNLSSGLLVAGSFDLPRSGNLALTTATLPAGAYTMTMSGTETVSVYNWAGVPEPASGMLAALAALAMLRRKSRSGGH